MIPFTQPSTAPDGTARRPLAERVPECVPASVKRDHGTGETFVTTRKGRFEELYPCDFAALWRVAVEDWIYRQCDFDLCGGTLTFVLEDRAVCSLNTWVTLGDPLPVVDLLNAAAHAVADAMGIAP